MVINGIKIHSVVFSGNVMEISYMEERDTSEAGIAMIRTLAVPAELVHDEAEDLLDSIYQVINKAEVVRRNPQASFTR